MVYRRIVSKNQSEEELEHRQFGDEDQLETSSRRIRPVAPSLADRRLPLEPCPHDPFARLPNVLHRSSSSRDSEA